MWLLAEDVARELRAAMATRRAPTADDRMQFQAFQGGGVSASEGRPRNMIVAGDVAEIRVQGVLTQRMDFWLWLLGYDQTTYTSIQAGIRAAESDPLIKRVQFFVDSPGGQVAGLFDTIAAVEGMTKPRSVRSPFAASAAYGFAAAVGKIEATNEAAAFGSVGVVATYFLDDELVEITSTEAPNKRPDPRTDEGKAVIREYLDAVHQLFADAIARGRGISASEVNKNYGRGALMLAAEAKKRGMIDRIAKASRAENAATSGTETATEAPPPAVSSSESTRSQKEKPSAEGGGVQEKEKPMDLKTLKAQHPETFEAAVQEGVKQERDRVKAHLKMGEQSGDLKTAFEAIRAGEGMTLELNAMYMSAAMNRADRTTRQAETNQAGAAADGAQSAAAENKDLGDAVASILGL